MNRNQDRARELLPAIVITVLSMIQALALELFWSKIRASDYLWSGGWDSAIGWLQLAVMFFGMLLIWILYIGAVLRFSWLPAMEDTLIPFYIGLAEFAMIDLMGPDNLGLWFFLLALIFTMSTLANHMVMRRARRDASNDYFFSNIAPASWKDYSGTMVAIAALVGFGAALCVFPGSRALALTALVFAVLALVRQFAQARKYWMHSIVSSGGTNSP